MHPMEIPERDTVSDLIGRAIRTMQVEDPDPAVRDRAVRKGQVYANLALARAIEGGFSEISDVGESLKTVAVELGSMSIAIAQSGEAR